MQVYSIDMDLNLLVDKIWIKENRVFFRVIKELNSPKKYIKKELEDNVYSISGDNIYSLRCRLYF
jgi:hypothetical protein